MMLPGEQQWSTYSFDYADVESLWKHLDLYEAECLGLLSQARSLFESESAGQRVSESAGTDLLRLKRFPVLGAYELALKCSHVFNLLDARGAISVTERVGVMARIRALVIGVAKAYAAQVQRVSELTSQQVSERRVG
jgi:glycyl-tRNA synthetase alpha chain